MSKTGGRDSPQTRRLKKVWKRRNAEAVWQNGRSESRTKWRPAQPLRLKYEPVC